jgi:DNA-binding response OmpR family regulator
MKKILIVEDDFYIKDIYEKSFRGGGYEVYTAVDGSEALSMVKGMMFDIILLDIMLPKVTGVDVLKELRKEGEKTTNIPVFMTTNLGQENIIKEAFRIGADGYFIKAQIPPRDLVREIDKFLLSNGL